VDNRFGWWLWRTLRRVPGTCPSNAHTAVILDHPGRSRSVWQDRFCRMNVEANGGCWCGKLRPAGAPVADHPAIRSAALDDPWEEL
jgi:hypothetical protein